MHWAYFLQWRAIWRVEFWVENLPAKRGGFRQKHGGFGPSGPGHTAHNHENYENADAPKSCRIVSTSKNSTFTMGSSTKDGRSLLTNVKGSKKVMISGPIINSDQRSEYKR